MPIVHDYSAAIRNHHIGWVKLSYLIDQKVLHHEPYEITLMDLDVLFLCLYKQLRKMLFQSLVSDGKHVHVLVKILWRPISVLLVHLFDKIVVILWVVVQLLEPGDMFEVLRKTLCRVALKTRLSITEHQFLEKPL